MPSFFPIRAAILLVHLDLDVHARRQIQLGERVDRLRPRIQDLNHALVRFELELLAALLVYVRRTQHGPTLNARWQRNRTADARARLLSRAHDVSCGLIDHCMIERLQTNPDLTSHCLYSSAYRITSVTTPAPTVRPPSRIAKRSSVSIAIGLISSISICTLSPGITISTPAGNVTLPVTSVVRK